MTIDEMIQVIEDMGCDQMRSANWTSDWPMGDCSNRQRAAELMTIGNELRRVRASQSVCQD